MYMQKFSHLYHRLGKKRFFSAAAAIVVFVVAAIFWFQGDDQAVENVETSPRSVELISVSDFQSGALGIAAPSADGRSFVVRAESSGRVDRIGKTGPVAQGAIIAELDNDSQRAALLQAEGVYEAALASAERSDIGVADADAALEAAKQGVVSADKAALTAWNSVLFSTIDQLFTNPRQTNPGVRINAGGQAVRLGETRYALNAELDAWQKESAGLYANQSVTTLINVADKDIRRIDQLTTMVDSFIDLLPKHDPDQIYTASAIASLQSQFASARATLNSQRSALEAAKTALIRAEENQRSASVAGTGGPVSAADAQIKQALGSYQAAQAAYNKTVVRAPFAGTVTMLNVGVGDVINAGSDVALVVPNDGVETSAFYTLPLSAVKYLPDGALVFIVNGEGKLKAKSVETGLVTASSIKVTGLNGDERVVKDVRGFKAGDEVDVK